MLQALSLGDRIGIITVLPNVVPMLRALGRRYSIEDRVGTIRVVNLPVLELHDHDLLASRLEIQAAEAIESGEADVIVLGCTGMLGLAQSLRQRLLARGLDVPVVDPTAAAIRSLETSVLLGLSPSRTTYMAPPAKERSSARSDLTSTRRCQSRTDRTICTTDSADRGAVLRGSVKSVVTFIL